MGVKVYWYVVAIVCALGMILPQEGRNRRIYIFLMAVLHSFICGCRYMFITGDLIKYSNGFYNYYHNPNISWFCDSVFNNGRNAGFEWVKKLLAQWTNGDFQTFLIILAIFSEIGLAILIYKFSPKPWLSYLVWNCMGFFVTYDFCAIKQGLAMGILLFSMIFILEKKPTAFLLSTLIAGFVHMPALAFLPAYYLMNRRVNSRLIWGYFFSSIIIFIYRNRILTFFTDIYYEGNDEIIFSSSSDSIGGRFVVILLIAFAGWILRGFRERDFAGLFNITLVAAIFQMFSSFSNIFTRFADYYLQFTVLFIPMILFGVQYRTEYDNSAQRPLLDFNRRSINILAGCLVIILIWWYWRTLLGLTITYEPDNYLNYRFMWDVVK